MRRVRGELYELREPSSDRRLWNADLAPTRVEQRTWSTYNMASLWVALSVCIPTYMLAAGLVQGGMSWWQAVLTILLGNLIVLVPMVLNAHAGTRYGIPFPVSPRASFGIRGANVPAILRGLVACGWFGIQTWIGGQAIYKLLTTVVSRLAARLPGGVWISLLRLLALEHAASSCAGATRSASGGVAGAAPDRRRPRPARLGHGAGRRLGTDPGAAVQVQDDGANSWPSSSRR